MTASWIVGTLLGDGYLDPSGRLFLEHSTKQKEYFLWKFEKLKALKALSEDSVPKIRIQKHIKTGRLYETIYIRSKPIFFLEREWLYPNGIKEIPLDLPLKFDAEALAVWYMDDGGRNSIYGSGMVIDVSTYSCQDRNILQKMLLSLFGFETTFHVRSEKNVKLYIRARSASSFCNLINPWIIPEMKYKLTYLPTMNK